MKIKKLFAQAVMLTLIFSCTTDGVFQGPLSGDLTPPQLLGITEVTETSIQLEFNEPVEISSEDILLAPDLGIESAQAAQETVTIVFQDECGPGILYRIDAHVTDIQDNSLSFIIPFYGHNPDLPEIVINEFTTQGSRAHPDLVELRVLSEGNTAGLTFFEGVPGEYEQCMVLPSIEVETDDYILIHTKPEAIEEEINETESTDISGGLDSSPEAYDLWLSEGTGLSGNNGVLSIYTSPSGTLVDAVAYSNRTSTSDEHYRGFGSTRVMDRMDCIHGQGGWTAAAEQIAPEDCIDPEDSTATRSMNRLSTSIDTNSSADWHITPTSGYTFGTINNDDEYSN
ncbi:MAG: hypothetical protein ACLFR1_05130 [Spirochaetia bacterium]